MALSDANPAFGPTEQGIMLELSELDRFGAIWIDSDTFENFRFSIRFNHLWASGSFGVVGGGDAAEHLGVLTGKLSM